MQKKTGAELLQIGSRRLRIAGVNESTREAKKLLAFGGNFFNTFLMNELSLNNE